MRRRPIAAVIVLLAAVAAATFVVQRRAVPPRVESRPRTVADVLARYGPEARARLKPHFRRAGVAYPPKEIALLAFKRERRLALWARGAAGSQHAEWRFIRAYRIQAASGHAGPKLREGDRQVPEGVYRIEHLNPNSSYHLSMKVSYPNAFDRAMARRDGRTRLGGDIFIHGKAVSIGCIAVGDPAIEELFTLVAETGHTRVKVLIAPNDLRSGGAMLHDEAPRWSMQLYRTLAAALAPFPAAGESDRGMRHAAADFR